MKRIMHFPLSLDFLTNLFLKFQILIFVLFTEVWMRFPDLKFDSKLDFAPYVDIFVHIEKKILQNNKNTYNFNLLRRPQVLVNFILSKYSIAAT